MAGGPLLRVATIRRTTDTFLFISHTTNLLLFKFRCNIFIGVRIIKEMPGSLASGTLCSNVAHLALQKLIIDVKGKCKAVTLHVWTGPEVSRKLRFPDFVTTAQDSGMLSALRTDRLYPQEILLVPISVRG